MICYSQLHSSNLILKLLLVHKSPLHLTDEETKQDMEHVLDTLSTIIPNHPFYHELRCHFDFILSGSKSKDLKELKLPYRSTCTPEDKDIVLIRTVMLCLCSDRIPIRLISKKGYDDLKYNPSHCVRLDPVSKDERVS